MISEAAFTASALATTALRSSIRFPVDAFSATTPVAVTGSGILIQTSLPSNVPLIIPICSPVPTDQTGASIPKIRATLSLESHSVQLPPEAEFQKAWVA